MITIMIIFLIIVIIIIPNNINHAEEGGYSLQVNKFERLESIFSLFAIYEDQMDMEQHGINYLIAEPCKDCKSVFLSEQGQSSRPRLHKSKCKEGEVKEGGN